jgi:hypothetical protein
MMSKSTFFGEAADVLAVLEVSKAAGVATYDVSKEAKTVIAQRRCPFFESI